MSETNDFNEDEAYVFSAADEGIVSATKQLLGKAASSDVITARGLESWICESHPVQKMRRL